MNFRPPFEQTSDQNPTPAPSSVVYRSGLSPISSLFGETFSNYFSNWKTYAGLSFIFLATTVFVTYFLIRKQQPLILALSFVVILYLFINTLFSAVSESGLKPTILRSLKKSILMPLSLSLIWILSFFAAWFGSIFFVIPGLIISTLLSLAAFSPFIDGKKGFRALSLSWYYVRNYGLSVFGRLLLLQIVVGVISIIFQLLIRSFFVFVPPSFIFVIIIALSPSLLALFVLLPISLIYLYNIYINLKLIKPPPTDEEEKIIRKRIMIFTGLGALIFTLLFVRSYQLHPQRYVDVYHQVVSSIKKEWTNESTEKSQRVVNNSTNQTTPVDPFIDWQTYQDPQSEFEFKYPSNWKLTSDQPLTFEATGNPDSFNFSVNKVSGLSNYNWQNPNNQQENFSYNDQSGKWELLSNFHLSYNKQTGKREVDNSLQKREKEIWGQTDSGDDIYSLTSFFENKRHYNYVVVLEKKNLVVSVTANLEDTTETDRYFVNRLFLFVKNLEKVVKTIQ